MLKRSETFFSGYDNSKIYTQKWEAENSCGTIIFTHGQAEHSDCYERLINGFQKNAAGKNWTFIGWDMRGHGKSEGIRGYAKDFDEYVLDFHLLLESCLHLEGVKNKPVILLSHSMGATVQTCAIKEKKYSAVCAQVLSAPFFGLSNIVPAWKDSGSELVNIILPKLTLGNELKNEQLTRDPEVIKEYEKDIYRHNKISAGVYLGLKREFPKMTSYAHQIDLPTLLHISDDDPVVSSPAALSFFESLASANKVLKIIEGAKHEPYNDIVREQVINEVVEFCNQFKKQ